MKGPLAYWEAAKKVIDRITYKPGFQITLLEHDPLFSGGLMIQFRRLVPNSEDPSHPIGPQVSHVAISYSMILLDDRFEEALVGLLFHYLREMELHELKEWLKLDGKWVDDPHPELRAMALHVKKKKAVEQ
jgi:hypothetical protein